MQSVESQLWSDKYASKKYFDLLTDDTTNRKVLTWLKSWDQVVDPSAPKLNLAPPQFSKKHENVLF